MNQRWLSRLCLFALLAASMAGVASAGPRSGADAPVIGIEELYRLDLLPRFRQSARIGMVSSYDRSGGNDDGFSGKYSFVRKEGDTLVLADLKGPGVIYRVWTPTPTDDPIEFYFDGEAEPRIRMKFRQLFDGSQPPFVTPVVGYGAGGFWSYLPLPYRTSCKVVLRAPKTQFYQINYATYPAGTALQTFQPGAQGEHLEKAQRLLGSAGTDISASLVPEGGKLRSTKVTRSLAPGRTVSLWESKRGGRIVGLRLSPASAFAGKDRATLLKIYWDGDREPAVASPVGDFFGYSWGDPAARGLLLGTTEGTCYAYFPMPFDRSARIELVSEKSGGPAIEVQAEILHADAPRRADEGKFYALWRRENPTTEGRPFTFMQTEGRGHVVGVALQAQGMESGGTLFFEGDDQATIDGELVAHGTGSEDFFNGGWYDVPGRWEDRSSFPLTGALDYKKPLARTGAYRFFLGDAYAFRKSLLLTIEHAPTENRMPTDYAGVTYLYSEKRPTMAWSLPPVAERAVRDPERLVYTPGWNVPLYAFSFQNSTLAKKNERIGSEEIRYLAFDAQGEDVFGPHYLAFLCEVPAAGRYAISIEAITGPDQGVVQLYRDERAVGEAVDLYSAERRKSGRLPLATLEMKEGTNQVFFKLPRKNPQSTGLGLDLVSIQFEKAR
ncbi:MAG TPA: glycoside hydrolase family 172 protein [Armatimonadota bacterium]|nr:glycoside hydrolase family 172 protein [Armatimonadota bacterium]